MSKFSLTSKALTALGSFFIGTPESMHMPGDFYSEKGDRAVPTVQQMLQFKTQRSRLTVEAARRLIHLRTGVLTTIVTVVLTVGALFIVQSVAAGHRELSQLTAPAATSNAGQSFKPYGAQ